MAEIKREQKAARNSAKHVATANASKGFTAEERAAMREHAQELKKAGHCNSRTERADAEGEVLAKIGEMPSPDRSLGERLHKIIKANAPSLSPELWYGMPAYANEDGNVVCFFQSAQKFKARYATLGFSDKAQLDEGLMWPTSYALKELTAEEEVRIGALVKRAVT